MGWSHPDISLEDLLRLIKGFVDILILASGYQSSGLPAIWDAQNVKKVVSWGIFFENVFRRLRGLDGYEDSVKEVDAALLEMTSNPYFPQGLKRLSSATLSRARYFVFHHLLNTLPLSDAHLSAVLRAAVEMDLDDLRGGEYDCLNVYLDKLLLQTTSLNLVSEKSLPNSMTSYPDIVSSSHDQTVHGSMHNLCGTENGTDHEPLFNLSNLNSKKPCSGNHSELVIQELSKRQIAVSCISSVEIGLDILSRATNGSKCVDAGSHLLEGQLYYSNSPLRKDQFVEFAVLNRWRSGNLSYMLDKRTIRLVSGANLIFSAPKVQWLQVFDQLKISIGKFGDDLLEVIELSLLGCIASRWSCIIEYFMSVSYDVLSISKQYHEVHNLLQGRSQCLYPKEEKMESKENSILEYLTVLLSSQLHQLWKISPILAAVAIPSWSPLFKLYLSEIESQLKESSSTIRCCTCIQDGKEHKECIKS
ncbi:PREDICTED: uncharacterized protein LOC104602787 isoform X2 [Nelumbo nucifera]|uniref:Uncharacterized protein LOC104602787 isoform X2 n=1 Tax=Nelumbo nucifera TaxID=4432 RepID=A0A1U8ABT5_NELNU|nr:PREDICTED: uncharacterized protein LOC104602787 isoform X2 [Nelumbo nucifera]